MKMPGLAAAFVSPFSRWEAERVNRVQGRNARVRSLPSRFSGAVSEEQRSRVNSHGGGLLSAVGSGASVIASAGSFVFAGSGARAEEIKERGDTES